MASSLSKVVTKFETLLDVIIGKIKRVDSSSLYAEEGTLGAGASKTYDLTALLPDGTTINDYYIQTAMVDLKVIDMDSTSPFYNQAIDSDAVMSYGITTAGILTIKNYNTISMKYWLRVITPAIK